MPTQKFRCIALLAATILLTGLAPLAAQDAPENIPGPFMAQALHFYFVHPGGPLQITLQAQAPNGPAGRRAGGSGTGTQEDPKILYRFFDTEENLAHWGYERLEPGTTTAWAHDFGADAPAGVYQVRYAGEGITVDVWANPARAFGFAPSRTMVSHAEQGQFGSMWFLVPPGTGDFSVRSIGMSGRIEDRRGETVAEFSHGSRATVQSGALEDALLRFRLGEARTGSYYRFGVSGIEPIIFCPDPGTAEAVQAHFKRTPEGRLYAHHFQPRMREWVDSLAAEDLAVERKDLADYEEHWLARPDEAAGLLGRWGAFSLLDFVLRDQNVTPGSEGFGQFETRNAANVLALAYSLNRPYNPYYLHPGVRNRLLLSVFLDLLNLNANDTWRTGDSSYSGGDALGTTRRFTPLQLAAPAFEEGDELFDLWVSAVRRLPDRFPFYRVSCDNQSSHWPMTYWKLYEVTGHETYKRLAEDYIAGMVLPEKNRFMQTGYQGEAYGPDATYQGLGAAVQALYYRLSGDPNALEGLRTIYHFFNHTVAPEPDGPLFGASGFSHRTRGSWANPQYGGGFAYMAGELPEAAVRRRSGPQPLTPEEIRENYRLPDSRIEGSPQIIGYSTHIIGPYWQNFRFPTEPLDEGVLPAEEAENFFRNFNDEFLAVRRGGYYFVAYLSGTAGEWVRGRRRTRPDADVHWNNKWNEVQGPQLFWTPEYGSLFTSMNWGADTLHMVRADLEGGYCSFPDYWNVESVASEEDGSLRMRQKMINLPLTVERRFSFGEIALEQTLTVSAEEATEVIAMYEQIPLLHNKPGFTLLFRNGGEWRDAPGPADAFWVGNEDGEGVLATLDRTMEFVLGERQEFRGRQAILPLRIMLPAAMEAGEEASLRIMFNAARADQR